MPDPESTSRLPPEFSQPRHVIGPQFSKGGMGGIWKATEPTTGRTIAVKKMLRPDDDDALRRFVTEARVTARLEHPNIVPVHELGADANGHVFYTMKLVQGTDLATVLRKLAEGDCAALEEHALGSLLTVFQKVCDALAFAHSRNIIHRDLKPANIMLGPFGEVLVMDWGLAKILGQPGDPDESSLQRPPRTDSAADTRSGSETMPGSALGTLYYMAPEQARGEVHRHDARTDIYALGGILYHLLCLRRPVSGSRVEILLDRVARGDLDPLILPESATPLDEHTDLPPDIRPPCLPRPVLRHLPGGAIPESLAAVVRRAMALQPEDRYQSTAELQREIAAYQEGFATSAERAGLGKQLVLFLRRHRVAASISALALLLLSVMGVASFLRIRQERDVAEEQRNRAQEQTVIATRERARAEEQAVLARKQTASAEEQRQRAEHESEQRGRLLEEAARSDRLVAQEKWNEGKESEAFAYLARAQKYRPSSTHTAEAAMPMLVESAIQISRTVLRGHSGSVWSAVFSSDGRHVLTASEDATARLWDAQSGQSLAEFKGHSGEVLSAVFSPDGRRVLTASEDATARLWEIQSRESRVELNGHSGNVLSAVFSPNGRSILTASFDKTARLWDAESGRSLAEFKGHPGPVWSAVFSPDGQRVLTASDESARLWDTRSGRSLAEFKGHSGGIFSATFSPDGRRVLANFDRSARLWDAQSGRSIAAFKEHSGGVLSAIFSPNGRSILTASSDKTARLWDAHSGRSLAEFIDAGSGLDATFSPDGRRFLTKSGESARLWDAQSGQRLAEFKGHTGSITSAVFRPDGQRVLTASEDNSARLWDAQSGQSLAEFKGHSGSIQSAVFTLDGGHVLTASSDESARLWNAHSGQSLAEFKGHSGFVWSAVFSPEGRRVLTASFDNTARLWDVQTGHTLIEFSGHSASVTSAVFSPNGRRILTASVDQSARLWDAQSGQSLADLQGHSGVVLSAVFSPDDQRVLTASRDHTARLWDSQSGESLAKFKGHSGTVRSAVFSSDGMRVLTASEDSTARLWDAQSRISLAEFKGHSGNVLSAVFSPDGKRVLTASEDNTARLWDARSGRTLAEFKGHTRAVRSVVFSPDGRRVLTASADKSARLWDAQSGESLAEFNGHLDSLLSATFGPDGRLVLTASADESARLWPIFPVDMPGSFPFDDLLHWRAGVQVGADGRLAPLSPERFAELDAWVRGFEVSDPTDPWQGLVHWFRTPASDRPITPYNTTSRQSAAATILSVPCNQIAAEHAYKLDPANPIVCLILSYFEKDEVAADFLRRYSLDRLPDDAALQLRATVVLRGSKQPKWALGYVERALWHLQDPEKVKALGEKSADLQTRAAELRATLRSELGLAP